MRRIWSAAKLTERGHVHGGNAGGNQFPGRKNIRIVETKESGALRDALGTVEETGLVNGYVDLIQAEAEQNLVDFVRAERPDVIDRIGLIGTIEILRSFTAVPVERLIFPKSEVNATELQALLVRQIEIDRWEGLSNQ